MLISRSIHAAAESIISFVFCSWLINTPLYRYTTSSLTIFSSVDGHLICFHVWDIINSETMNTTVHLSFLIRVFIFSRYIPRRDIAISYYNSIFKKLVLGSSQSELTITNLTSIHEKVGSIPGLAQWVKHPELPLAMVQVVSWHCRGYGVGQQLQLQFHPQPGNFHMPWEGPYKRPKKETGV